MVRLKDVLNITVICKESSNTYMLIVIFVAFILKCLTFF